MLILWRRLVVWVKIAATLESPNLLVIFVVTWSEVEIRAGNQKLLVKFINLPAGNWQETFDSRTLYFKLFTNICIITILSFLYQFRKRPDIIPWQRFLFLFNTTDLTFCLQQKARWSPVSSMFVYSVLSRSQALFLCMCYNTVWN